MIVSCEHCGARYKLDPARITGRGVRITCPRCKQAFVVYSGQAGAPEDEPIETASADSSSGPAARPAAPPPAATPPPPPTKAASAPAAPAPAAAAPARPRGDVGELDFASVGIQAWKVKVAIGLVYDFSDYKTLARYIKDGRVGEGDQISHDGKNWTVLGQIPNLEEHFFRVYEEAERRMSAAPAAAEQDGFDEETPTMIVGAASVASALGNVADLGQNLAAPRAGGGRAPAAEEESGGISAALSAALAAEEGTDEPRGPRFEDPFARARADRASGARRKKAAEPARGASAGSQSAGGGRKALVTMIGVGILVGGLGGGAWLTISGQRAAAEEKARAENEAHQAMLAERRKEIDGKAGDPMEEVIKKEIEDTLVEGPDDLYAEPEEERLTPVGPSGGTRVAGTRGVVVAEGGTMSTSASGPSDHYDAGRAAYGSSDFGAAARSFSAAVAGDPSNPQYYKWLGMAQMKLGDSGAVASFNRAAALGATDAYKYLGDLSAAQGDVAGAIGYYQQYLAANPGDPTVQQKIDALTH